MKFTNYKNKDGICYNVYIPTAITTRKETAEGGGGGKVKKCIASLLPWLNLAWKTRISFVFNTPSKVCFTDLSITYRSLLNLRSVAHLLHLNLNPWCRLLKKETNKICSCLMITK